MVALPAVTADGNMIFAKNSDRQPNEAHIIIRVPRRQYAPGSKVRCTYIEVEQAEQTYEVLLLKPAWIWGTEMGANEFGLNIGNEAVFTRMPYIKQGGLTGMDMVRLALERCRNADEALECMIELLERYGQGGNCGYDHPFYYHNAFLLADSQKAWKLETAGSFWAAQIVRGTESISNCLSIQEQYDRSHPQLVEYARQKGWLRKGAGFNFAGCYTEPVFTYFSGARFRRAGSMDMLGQNCGKITTATMKDILRSHHEDIEGRQFQGSSVRSVCMHAGFLYGDHTTGSYVASVGKDKASYRITGASTPCLAVFKPFFWVQPDHLSYTEEQAEQAAAYWWLRERLHRMALSGQITDVEAYLAERDRLEQDWEQKIAGAKAATTIERAELMARAQQEETELVQRYLEEACKQLPQPQGGWYFRRYWRKQNQKARGYL